MNRPPDVTPRGDATPGDVSSRASSPSLLGDAPQRLAARLTELGARFPELNRGTRYCEGPWHLRLCCFQPYPVVAECSGNNQRSHLHAELQWMEVELKERLARRRRAR